MRLTELKEIRMRPTVVWESAFTWRAAGCLLAVIMLLCLAGCSDGIRTPTPEQEAAFNAVGSITPTVDMDRVRKAKLVTGPYRVVSGDVLEFTMPALLRAVTEAQVREAQTGDGRSEPFICRVSDAGAITLPAVGQVQVAGQSLAQIESTIVRAYESYTVRRPSVYARVLEYRTSKVYVAGAVAEPGVYTLRADQMTLVSLLTEAGGISEAGAAVVRVIGADVQQDSLEETMQRLQDQITADVSPDPTVMSEIPARPVRVPVSMPVWTSAHMAAQPSSAVWRRSRRTQDRDLTTDEPAPAATAERTETRAGLRASLLEPQSGITATTLVKVGDNTSDPEEEPENRVVVLPVVGMNIPFRDVALTEGDTIVVEPSQMPIVSVLGLVRNPGNFEYPPYARYNLAQVIALAGGLDQDVQPRYATIYRMKPDGTIAHLPLRLIKGRSYTENLNESVRPGDLVAVENTPRTETTALFNRFFRLTIGTWIDLGDAWD